MQEGLKKIPVKYMKNQKNVMFWKKKKIKETVSLRRKESKTAKKKKKNLQKVNNFNAKNLTKKNLLLAITKTKLLE